MGAKKPYKSVGPAFSAEAENAFRFLVDELGFTGPELDDFMMPNLTYLSPAMRYEVTLDTHEDRVWVSARLKRDGGATDVTLESLVTASGIGSGQHVFTSARTVAEVLKALADQAQWLRRLHPILTAEGGPEIIERVGRRWTSS